MHMCIRRDARSVCACAQACMDSQLLPNSSCLLTDVGCALLSPYVTYLDVPPIIVHGCCYMLEKLYWASNPFTNSVHAAYTAHQGFAMIKMLGLAATLPDAEAVAFIVAALGHDICHTGRNHHFFVNSNNLLVNYAHPKHTHTHLTWT